MVVVLKEKLIPIPKSPPTNKLCMYQCIYMQHRTADRASHILVELNIRIPPCSHACMKVFLIMLLFCLNRIRLAIRWHNIVKKLAVLLAFYTFIYLECRYNHHTERTIYNTCSLFPYHHSMQPNKIIAYIFRISLSVNRRFECGCYTNNTPVVGNWFVRYNTLSDTSFGIQKLYIGISCKY